MKEKKLYISAIIPSEFYVSRDADRKLREVIQRMSKPAYISVARQMGKTNLLIQTKLDLEDRNHRYVFIDITNNFNSAQDCFRYIIDQIIDSNDDVEEFQIAAQSIKAKRQPINANPTKEYQDELREILKIYPGKLVIFLDEVDDLRKHEFSDDIFAQIRKTYFLRVTYPVFNRLSYVLCGVIDPEKLIRNKDNSPFNIAIPIYLDDFNKKEFYEFIIKSELVLSDSLLDYIYEWLRGNPRMTFDIISKIEDEIIDGKEIDEKLVDDIIYTFYLKDNKNPPVDHIRDIIKHNNDVRKSVMKLKEGKSGELSDDARSKLYLYGIIGSKINEDTIYIKNRVLEKSLSNEWLHQIELEKKGYYELGVEKVNQEDYIEGIKYLTEYIQNDEKAPLVHLANYNIGKAYYQAGKYELSNSYLLKKPIEITSGALYYQQIFYIGINYFKQGNLEDAYGSLNDIILNSQNSRLIGNSYVNIGEIFIIQKRDILSEISPLYLKALDFVLENQTTVGETNAFLTPIYFRLGELYKEFENKKTEALSYLEKALALSEDNQKPQIILNIDFCVKEDKQKREILYLDLANLIIEKKLKFNSDNTLIPFREIHLYICLINLFEFQKENQFSELLNYSASDLFSSTSQSEILFNIAIYALNQNEYLSSVGIFNRIINENSVDQRILRDSYKILGLYTNANGSREVAINYLIKYINIFEKNNNFNDQLQTIDFSSFTAVIAFYRQKRDYNESHKVASIILKYINPNLSIELKSECVVIYFYVMDYYVYIGIPSKAIEFGNKILSFIEEIKSSNYLSSIDRKGLQDIENQTRKYLLSSRQVSAQIQPIKIVREKGRNEWVKVKYKNGTEVYSKYKKIKEDLEKGDCKIIE